MLILSFFTQKFQHLKGQTKQYIEDNLEVEKLLNFTDEPDIFTDEEIQKIITQSNEKS